MRHNILMFGMALLLLLVPTVFAATTPVDAELWVRANQSNNRIDVSLLVFESGQPPSAIADTKANYDRITAACQGSADVAKCIQDESKKLALNPAYPVSFKTIENANFSLFYLNEFAQGGPTWLSLTDCTRITANQRSDIYKPESTTPIPLWTATCNVDKKLYEGRKIDIKIISAKGDAITVVEPYSVTFSDVNASTAAMFSSGLTRALASVTTAISVTSQGQTVPCLAVFIILGLLLASMYFSGKSPISLLDITTPRLPSPKGFTASGQTIIPFGYGETRKAVAAKTAAAAIVAAAAWNAGKGSISASDAKDINTMAGKMGDSQHAAVFKSVALEHLKNGGKIADLRALAKPFTQYTTNDNASLRLILKKLERMGGRTALIAKTAIDVRQSADLMQSLAGLGHQPKSKFAKKVSSYLSKAYGADRFTTVGPMVTGSYDAALRSLKLLGRGTKAAVVHGTELARETGKFAVTTVGGQGAMKSLEQKAKTSAAYATIYNQLTKKPGEMKLGDIMQVNMKMAHLFKTLCGEVERDQMRYLMKQIYKKLGVNVAAMTDKELFAVTNSMVDPLKVTGYSHSAKLAAIESEMHSILAAGASSAAEKRDKLEALYKSMGGHLDSAYANMKSQIDKITKDRAEDHVKMLMLQETLDRENNALKAAREGEARLDDKYYCLVGRANLTGSDVYEVMLLRKMISEMENGRVTKDVSIRDFMNAVRLELENKVISLNAASIRPDLLPEYARDAGVRQKKTKENRELLASLITDEGEKVLKNLTGKSKHNADLGDFMSVLFGNEYLIRKQGLVSKGGGVHYDPKTGKALWLEEDKAVGPQANWWKVDMKQHWLNGITTNALQLTTTTAIQAKADRSFTSILSGSNAINAGLERHGARTWTPEKRLLETKKAWVKDLLEKELHNSFNDRYAMNAYGNTTNETSRFYVNSAAALLAKSLREAGFEERHTDLRFLEHMDITNPKDMARFRDMIGTRYKKQFEEVLKKGITFDDISKSNQAWVMTHEGGYVPYRPGMPLSDNDRLLNGRVAIHDGKAWRSFSPDDVRVEFKGNDALGMAFNKLANNSKKEEWQPFISNLMEWARPGGKGGDYEKEKIVGAVLWRYANTTYDYQSYWNKSAVKLVPRHEATSLAPTALRQFGVEAHGLMSTLKPLREYSQLVGQFLVKSAITGTGDTYLRSYDTTPKSNLLKMYSWRLSTQILTSDMEDLMKDVTSEADRRKMSSALRAYALTHGAMHQAQAFTWDRNPWRSSTSHGTHQAYSAAFPYGPAMTYSMKANVGAVMSKEEFWSFMIQGGWAAALARKAIMPYQKMIAAPQRSIQGYASAHDWNAQDALRAYGDHTPPRLLEALRGYNPFSFSWGSGNSRFSRALQNMNWFESRAEKAQLTGYDHQMGLLQGYAGIQTIYKGPSAIARTGMANPSASYTDTKFNEQLAPAMAEYAVRRMGPMSGFYREDDYVMKMAMTDTVRRTVSAEALAIKRQQELMSFGVLQNPLYTWFNPLLFTYHMGIPGYPTTMSPKELLNNFVNKWRRGGSSGNLEESAKSLLRKTAEGVQRVFSPKMATMQKFCRCGSPGMIGNSCKSCGNQL